MAAIRDERTKLAAQLTNLETTLEAGRQLIHAATELLADPEELYRQSDPAGRRLLALTIFGRLYVHTKIIVDHDVREPFNALVNVQRRQAAAPASKRHSGPVEPGWGDLAQLRAYQQEQGTSPAEDAPVLDQLSPADLLDLAFAGHGSRKALLVGVAGFEPTAFRSQSGRATKLRHTP
jgi:hypothetical protein